MFKKKKVTQLEKAEPRRKAVEPDSQAHTLNDNTVTAVRVRCA